MDTMEIVIILVIVALVGYVAYTYYTGGFGTGAGAGAGSGAGSTGSGSILTTTFNGVISGAQGSASNPNPMWAGWVGPGYYYFPDYGSVEANLSSPAQAQQFALQVTGSYSNLISQQTGVSS